MNEIRVVPVSRLTFRIEPYLWPWARANRSTISAHFSAVRRARPAIFNGRVLLLHRWAIEGDAMRGAFFETDFADLLAWRDMGFPDHSVVNCFAMGALRAADGAYILGVMNAHTSNPGSIYFPSGTPDPDDAQADGTVDLIGSVARELHEETGLKAEDLEVGDGWHAVIAPPQIALMRPLSIPAPSREVLEHVRAYIVPQRDPEFADVIAVRDTDDFPPEIPAFMRAYLAFQFGT